MLDLQVKAIIKEPFYKFPYWLRKNSEEVDYKEYFILSKDASFDDVDLFLAELFRCNNIDVGSNPSEAFSQLVKEEEVTIPGGILFIEKTDKMVFPGYSFGLEGWREVANSVVLRISPWMGHTPYPTLEFIGNKVRVWSDDYLEIYENDLSREDMYYIEYNYDDLIAKLRGVENEIKQFFLTPLFNRIKQIDEKNVDQVIDRLGKWFKLNV